MSRYPSEHKARTRRRIVETAARLLRRRGVGGTAIGTVMKRAGLTHGGFYGHFASKDELVAEACAAGVEEARRGVLEVAARERPEERVRAILAMYHTDARRDEGSCTLATLGSEIARQPGPVRDALTHALARSLDDIAAVLPGESEQQRTDAAIALIAGMAGAMTLARAVSDPGLSDRILDVARRVRPAVEAAPEPAGKPAPRR